VHQKRFQECRAQNLSIPIEKVMVLSAASKMRGHVSVSKVPTAICNHKLIQDLGYALYDPKGNLKDVMANESGIRSIVGRYVQEDFFNFYNKTVQDYIIPLLLFSPVHFIVDCTKIHANIENKNYEGAKIATEKKHGRNVTEFGYKLATIYAVIGDTGILVECKFGPMNISDIKLCRDMLRDTPILKPGDTITYDRGFNNRGLVNMLKNDRLVDVYTPAKKGMDIYKEAVSIAKMENNWSKHPTRAQQKIAFVPNLGNMWQGTSTRYDAQLNACVVWDQSNGEYYVFLTTNVSEKAKMIIRTYETRMEIEAHYRQLKIFMYLEKLQSQKLNVIGYHIVSTLLGYLFFQLYTLTDGQEWLGRSLACVAREDIPKPLPYIVIYSGNVFGVFSIGELIDLSPHLEEVAREGLKRILDAV